MNNRSGFKLGVTCCFCGGALEIDQASHAVRCPHCASALKVCREGMPRYYLVDDLARREVKFLIERHLKKIKQPLVSRWGEITKLYLPFWRVTGTVFTIIDNPPSASFDFMLAGDDAATGGEQPRAEVKITDKEITCAADPHTDWGIASLGVRTQVLTLTPVDRKFLETAHLVGPTLNQDAAADRFAQTIGSSAVNTAPPGSHVDLTTIGIEASLIYFPLWIAEFTNNSGQQVAKFDPLAKRVLAIDEGEFQLPKRTAVSATSSPVQIIPHRCPNCGDDLPDREHSITFYCANCYRLWIGEGLGYKQLEVHVPARLDGENSLFPFWVIDLSAENWPHKDELFKSFKLTGFRKDLFYVPAFDVSNPVRLLRLINHYNRRDDTFDFTEQPTGKYSFVDVTITPALAAGLIIPLTNAAKALRGYHSHEAKAEGSSLVDVASAKLVWLPFTEDSYFWREQITGATIERAAVHC